MDFRPRQLIAAMIVVSAITSFLVAMVTISAVTGEQPGRVIERIVERAPAGQPSEREIAERVLRQDELVVAAVKRAAPAVVSVVVSKDVPVVEQFFVDPFAGDPFLEQFFGDSGIRVPQLRQRGTRRQDVGFGTGFVVSADGLLLTNRHVVSDAAAGYTVFLSDNTKLPAKVLARDPSHDLAILKVDPPSGRTLTPLPLGDSARVEIGQSVIAIGNALGEFRNTVSVGVISGLQRAIVAEGGAAGRESLTELIQTDAAINPGNSGGPLLNLRGEAIGINTAIAQGAENIGFTIPINQAKRAIESVQASGRIIYPFLGVRYVMVTKELAAEQTLPIDYGALITGDGGNPAVTAGSPAEKAGLKSGDIILEFNGEKLEAGRTLASLIAKYKVGDRITMGVRRGSDTLTLTATLEERK